MRFFTPGDPGPRHRRRAGTALRSAAARARSRPDEAGVLQRDQEQLRSDEAPRHSAHPHRHGCDARASSASPIRAAECRRRTLGRVFEPYFTTKQSGSGLGLLIIRRIVREHGGEMAIESNEGKGITLTIRLPYLENGCGCWRREILRSADSGPVAAARLATLKFDESGWAAWERYFRSRVASCALYGETATEEEMRLSLSS